MFLPLSLEIWVSVPILEVILNSAATKESLLRLNKESPNVMYASEDKQGDIRIPVWPCDHSLLGVNQSTLVQRAGTETNLVGS